MICYPDKDHKYKVDITGGIICYEYFRNFVNYFSENDLIVLFVSNTTSDITKYNNTIVVKLSKLEIEHFYYKILL